MTKYQEIWLCELGNECYEVFRLFERKGETLVEVASGPRLGHIFYTKSENVKRQPCLKRLP